MDATNGRAAVFGSSRMPVARRYLLLSLGAVAAFLVYQYHSPGDSHVSVFDNLDGPLPMYKMLAERPIFDGIDAVVPEVFDGIPKNALPSQLNLYAQLFRIFAPAHAYVANDMAIRLVALFGMLCLLRFHLAKQASDLAVAGASTAFALLPHLPSICLTVPGLPLVAHAMLSIRAGGAFGYHWLILAVYPFCSVLPLTGWVILVLFGTLYAVDAARRRHLLAPLAGALILLGAGYVVAEHRLFYQVFFETNYVSHRLEFRPLFTMSYTAAQLTESALAHFLYGFFHAASLQYPVVLICVVSALFVTGLILVRSGQEEHVLRAICRRAAFLVLLIAGSSLIFALGFHYPYQTWQLGSGAGVVKTLNVSRFAYLEPVLWMACFALGLELLIRRGRWGRYVAMSLLVIQIGIPFYLNEHYLPRRSVGITFDEFYSPELFRDIQAHVGEPPSSYRILSVGMPPGIALFSGFHTLDGYVGNYPLAYKHRFRRVIARELEKSPRMRAMFDRWGSQCFVFAAELEFHGAKENFPGYTKTAAGPRAISQLELDAVAMRDLGVDYVLSAVRIDNHRDSDLEFVEVFERDGSPWQIFLYRLGEGVSIRRSSVP